MVPVLVVAVGMVLLTHACAGARGVADAPILETAGMGSDVAGPSNQALAWQEPTHPSDVDGTDGAAATDDAFDPSAPIWVVYVGEEGLWSPDGAAVAIVERGPDEAAAIAVAVGLDGGEPAMTAAGRGVRWEPLAWSPDGRVLALARVYTSQMLDNGRNQVVAKRATIWTVDPSTPASRELVEVPPWREGQAGVPAYAAWSPGGRYLTFGIGPPFPCAACFADGLRYFAVSTLDGTLLELGRALRDGADGPRFAWGPADGFVVLSTGGGRETYVDKQLVRVDFPTGERRDLSGDPRRADLAPSLSPDGHQIVFARGAAFSLDGTMPPELPPGPHPNVAAIGTRRLWIMDDRGADSRQITDEPGWTDEAPVWTPDGEWIVFVRWRSGDEAGPGVAELWAVRADGTQAHSLRARLGQDRDFNDGFGYYGSFGWRDRFAVARP